MYNVHIYPETSLDPSTCSRSKYCPLLARLYVLTTYYDLASRDSRVECWTCRSLSSARDQARKLESGIERRSDSILTNQIKSILLSVY